MSMRFPSYILAILLLPQPFVAQQQTPPATQNQDQTPPPADKKAPPPAAAPDKKHTTADDNPFPEDISKKAAAQGDDASTPPNAPGKPSASEPPPNYSSSRTNLPDADAPADSESRISNGAGGYILNPRLATQDVKIGGFYLNKADYKGAYARFKEATKVNPEDADAVFGLAEAARGLKLKDEAAENYRIYLDAFPDGAKAKAARKALAELGPAPKK
jgi:tetratricopeptide (TPR) repeat protein